MPFWFCKFNAVGQYISNNLSKSYLIDAYKCGGLGQLAVDPDRFFLGDGRYGANCRLNQLANGDQLLIEIDPSCLYQREIEKTIDDTEKECSGIMNVLSVLRIALPRLNSV